MIDALLIDRVAHEHTLDARVIRAVVAQESGGNPFAFRPEPRFRYFVDCRTGRPFRHVSPDELGSKVAPPDFPYLAGGREQEWWAQQASIGLMQIMGAVARELGFKGPYLLELTAPTVNLDLGCRLLASHLKWSEGDLRLALGAYNAGRGGAASHGVAYAQKVLARVA